MTFPTPATVLGVSEPGPHGSFGAGLFFHRDEMAENVDDVLLVASKLTVGNSLGVPFEGVHPRELLLEESTDGSLLVSLVGDLAPEGHRLILGSHSSPYAPIASKTAVSGSSLSISTSKGTPAGFR